RYDPAQHLAAPSRSARPFRTASNLCRVRVNPGRVQGPASSRLHVVTVLSFSCNRDVMLHPAVGEKTMLRNVIYLALAALGAGTAAHAQDFSGAEPMLRGDLPAAEREIQHQRR